MDQNDPAWKIAEAAQKSLYGGDPDALDKALTGLQASAKDIARAYALCLMAGSPFSPEAIRLVLNARLQVVLVQEHVAAQRRMGRVLVWLTIVLTLFGAIDIWQRLHGWQRVIGPSASPAASHTFTEPSPRALLWLAGP